jgi:hypothetical protein
MKADMREPRLTSAIDERWRAPAIPINLAPGLTRSLLRCEGRSLRADVAAMIARLPERPIVRGLEHVPPSGPACLLANHYQRRGLWIGWAGAAITWAMGPVRVGDPPVHWLVTADCPGRNKKPAAPFSGWILRRVASVWGMVSLPQDPADVAGRARALRRLLTLLDSGHAVGLFPEGHKGRAGAPGPALPRALAFIERASHRGIPIVPVAVRARSPTMAVAFGPPLTRPTGDVMAAIRALYESLEHS